MTERDLWRWWPALVIAVALAQLAGVLAIGALVAYAVEAGVGAVALVLDSAG